ncbi:MAG: hypothetical protein E2598_05620 [Sphingobium sp.]|nr:hypothetical protein [Sphingobium sp.]
MKDMLGAVIVVTVIGVILTIAKIVVGLFLLAIAVAVGAGVLALVIYGLMHAMRPTLYAGGIIALLAMLYLSPLLGFGLLIVGAFIVLIKSVDAPKPTEPKEPLQLTDQGQDT